MATANETKFVLTAEDKTSPALQSITRGLQGMESQAMLASRALGAIGVTFSAAAVVAMVKGTIDAADGFNDLSQRVGISVKNLAGWTLAANQSGTSMESVAKGVKGLSTYMVDHADKLKKAGITATDVNGAMIQLADLFQAMPDGVEKTALAVQIFGKAGMDMIPMLNMGSKGLAEAQEKAAEYGRRMAELAPQADKFNDLLGEMALQSKVFGINMAIEVVPSLTKFAEQLNESKKIAGGWTSAMWEFGVLLDPTKGIPNGLNETRAALEKLHAEMEKGKAQNLADGGMTDLSDVDKSIGVMERRKKFLEFMQRQGVMEDAAKLGDYRDARDLRLANSGTMSVAEAMAKAAALRAKAGSGAVGISPLQKMRDLGERNLRAASAAEYASVDDDEEARLFGPKLNTLSLQNDKRQTDELERQRQKYVEMADPLQKYRLELDEINKLRDAGLLTSAQATEAEWQVNGAMDETVKKMLGIKEAGEDAFAGLTSVVESWGNKAADTFADFVVDGKASFSDLINSMLKDIARLQAKRILDPVTKGASDWLGGALGKGIEGIFGGGGGTAPEWNPEWSFAGGGFTGNGARTGGLDGQGGFLAMMHPRETVIDHTTGGGGAGQPVVVNMSLNFAVGISQTVRAEVMNLMPTIQASAQSAVMEARLRGGASRLVFKG